MFLGNVKFYPFDGDIVRVLADGSRENGEKVFEDESNQQILNILFNAFSYSFNNKF